MSASDYSSSDLYRLLNVRIPSIKKIEEELRAVEPRIVSEMIAGEPECVYILDYYFRIFAPEIGGRIISHEQMDPGALVELFNCQLIRYYRVNMHDDDYDAAYSSVMNSYWKNVEKDKMLNLLKNLIAVGESSKFSAIMVLHSMRLSDLQLLQRDLSEPLLKFFKKFTEISDIIEYNLDLYDYIYLLARQEGDADYLQFLDDYTNLAVRLRIAQSFAREAELRVSAEGKIPLNSLVDLIEEMPREFLKFTLQILNRRGLVAGRTIESLQNLIGDTRQFSAGG